MESRDHFKNAASPKSHTSRRNLKIFAILAFIFFASCDKDDKKDSGFKSPEEYIENPSVLGAIDEADMPVYKGDTPPPLAGTYLSDGEVTDVSSTFDGIIMIGTPVESEFILSNQTTSGKIDFEERVGGIKATGSGGYITGANGKFTIYMESKQTGSEAGLPNGVSVTAVLLMSGTKVSNGDLSNVEGLTVYTSASTSNRSYDVSAIKGSWYKWEADFYLQTGRKSASVLGSSTNSDEQLLLQKALQIIKEQIKSQTEQ